MACFKKIAGKWHLEEEVKAWAKAIKERNSLLAKRAKAVAAGRGVVNIDKDISKINDIITEYASNGITDARDGSGNPDIDSIFTKDGLRNKTRSDRGRVLDKLTVKSHGLAASGVTVDDVYNHKKAEFDALGISLEDVAAAMTTKWDYESSLTGTRAGLTSFESPSNKGFVPKYVSYIRDLWSKRDALRRKEFKGLWKENLFRENRIKAAATTHAKGLTELNQFMGKGPGTKLSDAEKTAVSRYLDTEGADLSSITSLPATQKTKLKNILDEVRLSLDVLSSLEQAYGGISNSNVVTFQNNKGTYLTRSYRAFQNQEWVDELASGRHAHIMDGARRALRPSMENRRDRLSNKIAAGKAVESEKAEYRSIVSALANPMAFNDYILGDIRQLSDKTKNESVFDKKGKLNTKTIKQRKDLSPEIKALLGDIDTDPAQAVALAATRIAERVANYTYQSNIASIMNDNGLFLFASDSKKAIEKGWEKVSLSGEANAGFKDVLGVAPKDDATGKRKADHIFVPPEIAPLIQGMLDSTGGISPNLKDKNVVSDSISAVSALMKKALTVWNVAGQSSNVLGNPAFAIANGDLRITNAKTWVKEVVEAAGLLGKNTEFLSKISKGESTMTEAESELLDIAITNGLADSSAVLESMKELTDSNTVVAGLKAFRDKVSKSSKIGKGVLDVLGFIDGVAVDSYNLGDSVFKVAALKIKLDEFAKHHGYNNFESIAASKNPNKIKDKQKIIDVATTVIRNNYPNYNELYSFAKKNRASKFIGPFISFVAEQMRTTHASVYNQIKFSKDKSLPAPMRAAMLRDLGHNIAVRGVAGIMLPGLLTAMLGGMSAEEEELIRDSMAYEFERESGILINNGDGTYNVFNSGYINPAGFAGDILLPTVRTLTGKSDTPILKALGNTAIKTFAPFLSPELAVNEAAKILTGTDDFGRQIIEASSIEGKYAEFIKFAGKVPGISNWAKRVEIDYAIDQLSDQLSQEVEKRGSSSTKNKREKDLERKMNLLQRRYQSKKILSSRSVGVRHTVHNKEQDISYAFLNINQKKKEAKANFKALVKKDSFDTPEIERAYAKSNSEYKKGIEEAKRLYERVAKYAPEVDLEQVMAGERKISGSVDKKATKLFTKKELDYITGKEDKVPELTIQEAEDRLKALGAKSTSGGKATSKPKRSSRRSSSRRGRSR